MTVHYKSFNIFLQKAIWTGVLLLECPLGMPDDLKWTCFEDRILLKPGVSRKIGGSEPPGYLRKPLIKSRRPMNIG